MRSEHKLLSRAEFGSFLIYSPRGISDISKNSRKVRDAIKTDIPGKIEAIIERLVKETTNFYNWFDSETTLIPVPKSSPLPQGPNISPSSALWVSKRICEEMQKKALGGEIVTCLMRTQAVKKSAFSAPGERPSIDEHFQTMTFEPKLLTSQKLILVDDVITKGRTLHAAISLVKETFPQASVKGFALLRTMGLVPEITKIIDPCIGTLNLVLGDTDRNP